MRKYSENGKMPKHRIEDTFRVSYAEPRNELLFARVAKHEKQTIAQRAARQGKTMSEFVRVALGLKANQTQ